MGRSPPVADLRLHTTTSDGRLTIDALPDATHAGGMDVVAVTDYDRYRPELDAPVVERDGVTAVHDIELRVDADGRRVGLLGYGLRERPALVKIVERLQRNRVERAREIVAAVEEETGVRLEVNIHDGVGRPHVVHATDASETPYDYQGAFDELIGADGPYYVAHELPVFGDDVAALRDACDVVGLAHPFRYHDPADAFRLCVDLDAVGRYYPYGFDVEANLVKEAVGHCGLLTAGRSDAHDETLGCAGPLEADFARFTVVVDGL